MSMEKRDDYKITGAPSVAGRNEIKAACGKLVFRVTVWHFEINTEKGHAFQGAKLLFFR